MKRRFDPPLNKHFLTEIEGYALYAVNAFAIRNAAEPDEEFDSFATHDEFPDLIPKDQIWLSDKSLPREGRFIITDAVARLKARDQGLSESKAYDVGLAVERTMREQLTGIKYRDGRPQRRSPAKLHRRLYFTLRDVRGPIEVWVINGHLVRCLYKTDYTEGGHGYVYPWCPKHEIWLDDNLERAEMPLIVAHEYTELRLMRDEQMKYDRAHEICAEVEFALRRRDSRAEFPGLSRRKLTRADLPALTRPEFFEYVLNRYARNLVRRAGAALTKLATKALP